MSKKYDGGPAFPVVPSSRPGEWSNAYTGMTLRDWFAGHASREDVMRHRFENPDGSERKPALTVEQAKWEYADAMLAGRDL